MKQKVSLITGATSGIGKAIALGLSQRGHQLLIIGRSKERGIELQEAIHAANPGCSFQYYLADLADVSGMKEVSERILQEHPVIDLLINNAGGVFSSFELTPDGVERTMANNHLGYFISTLKLLPALARSEDPRILITSSATHYKSTIDFETFHKEKKYQIMRAYGQSKLANVLFTYALARRLKDTDIKANVFHPGVVKTPIGNKSKKAFHRFAWNIFTKFKGITSEQSARTYLRIGDDLEGAKYRGQYFHDGVHQDSAELSYDEELQEKLWQWSVAQTGVDFQEDSIR